MPPPAMSTFPFCNNVAVCNALPTVMLPVGTKTPCSAVVPAMPPLVLVAPPPPVPMVFIVATCCSSIGVRKQASPVNDNTTPIANHRPLQIILARLPARGSEGTLR